MNTLLNRLKKAFPFLSERAVTVDDLHAYCDRRGVAVAYRSEISTGLYAWHRPTGDECIFLSPRLFGATLLYVFCHEVAHMILHVPSQTAAGSFAFDGGRCSRINHEEAETAAALMMFPHIEAIDTDLLDHADPRFKDIIARRLHYEVYGAY